MSAEVTQAYLPIATMFDGAVSTSISKFDQFNKSSVEIITFIDLRLQLPVKIFLAARNILVYNNTVTFSMLPCYTHCQKFNPCSMFGGIPVFIPLVLHVTCCVLHLKGVCHDLRGYEGICPFCCLTQLTHQIIMSPNEHHDQCMNWHHHNPPYHTT